MSERIPIRDRATARALDIGSAFAIKFPGTIGKAFAPDGVTPRRWFASTTPADQIAWQTFKGVDKSGYRPLDYKQGVVLQAPAVDFIRLHDDSYVKPAAAYALGGAIMATRLRWVVDSEENISAAFGIGRGVLEAQLGLLNQKTREFIQLPDVSVPVQPNEMNAILAHFPTAQRV
jgi:hypothetical protein